MKKHYGNNPIFILLGFLVPWRYFGTYYCFDSDKLTTVQYWADKKQGSFKKVKQSICVNQIEKIGIPSDFKLERQEAILTGKYGRYVSQEMVFILEDDSVIGWNMRPYSMKQINHVLNVICSKTENKVILGKKIKKMLKIN